MKERPGAGWGTVALHDVAPAHWQACRDILADLEAAGSFPVSLLVVPRYHGKARDHGFEHWLRERQAGGDEIVLHGYSHLDTGSPAGLFDHLKRRCYTRGEGEFAALTQQQAWMRLHAGQHWLADAHLQASGFVAPAWLLSEGSRQALRCHGFDYTCTLRQLVLLDSGRALCSQAQVWSSASAWPAARPCCGTARCSAGSARRRGSGSSCIPRTSSTDWSGAHGKNCCNKCSASRGRS